ncbi:hypothetical protein IE53DRAFT_374925 [Violaceomyces palustris]|uniref:Uncharacterized protein n=1 Tax=Violaceomyces palustris TaxID=1673888 RepID=A0ACD0NVH9_9BASI|nr:hypothetical protein IE53DRAFT_374925 [Violaceomyces palustris]
MTSSDSRDPRACTVVYKILTPTEAATLPPKNWAGTSLDVKDGFLHLSTADQLPGVLSRYFSKESGVGDELRIYSISRAKLEESAHARGIKTQFDPVHGTVFYHIYGAIDPESDFFASKTITRSTEGAFELGGLEF